jgi:hypothetical protein
MMIFVEWSAKDSILFIVVVVDWVCAPFSWFHSFLVWVMIIIIIIIIIISSFFLISGVIRVLVIDTMVDSWWSRGRSVLLASHASLGPSF